jgi:orotate phosphoribosyltransferase
VDALARRIYDTAHLEGEFRLRSGAVSGEYFDKYVVTSGGQLIESCTVLRERGADIVAVLCVIDRESGGAAKLAAHGLELRALFTMSRLGRR